MNILKSSPIIKKLEKPVLTYKDVPEKDSCLIFNAGVAKYKGRYVMAFRNDHGDILNKKLHKGVTNIGIAYSDDGIKWEVDNDIKYSLRDDDIMRLYDPRLTVVDGVMYMCCAVDTRHGIRGGIAKLSDDLKTFEIMSLSVPDNRNMVLFPEKIDGMYVRLERPMPVYAFGRDKFDLWMSVSPDLKFWGESKVVLSVEDVPFCSDKIGPAAPPVKTPYGWLTTFHSVILDEVPAKNGWEPKWGKKYYGGIMLLDLNDPSKVIGMSKEPLIATDKAFENDDNAFRGDVIFPGGMILEDNGEVKIYYGAADTYECMATASLDDLIALCKDKK